MGSDILLAIPSRLHYLISTKAIKLDRKGKKGGEEQLTVAMDSVTGDYTRLTRFKAGADTKLFGGKSHDYPEEIYIISGRLYDVAFEQWLEAGYFASRPPGEIHGPFICEQDCLVMEVSFPSQSVSAT